MTEARHLAAPVVARLLTKKEAAAYCGVSVPTFSKACPVTPAELYAGLKRYDRRQLDAWIDTVSKGSGGSSFDEALDQLG
jgi:hypothetical protein